MNIELIDDNTNRKSGCLALEALKVSVGRFQSQGLKSIEQSNAWRDQVEERPSLVFVHLGYSPTTELVAFRQRCRDVGIECIGFSGAVGSVFEACELGRRWNDMLAHLERSSTGHGHLQAEVHAFFRPHTQREEISASLEKVLGVLAGAYVASIGEDGCTECQRSAVDESARLSTLLASFSLSETDKRAIAWAIRAAADPNIAFNALEYKTAYSACVALLKAAYEP
jgi:hypothetical protein